MDNHDPNLDYGSSDFDVDHRFVSSYVYQLPFGRGQKFANQVNRGADVAIGGWQTTAVSSTFQSGFPFTVQANDVQGY